MNHQEIITWLLEGDVSVQYQVYRDLFSKNKGSLRKRIATEGWGAKFLAAQNKNGHWGQSFYQPKWISTHYSLLDLKNLGISPSIPSLKKIINVLLENNKGPDGGMNPSPDIKESDVCLNGMFLNYACYFKPDENQLESIIDYVLEQRMADGGFNCRFNRSGANHSSLHSTLSVLEGILEYEENGYTYRLAELKDAQKSAEEFILMHQLFISDRTGKIIHKDFLKLAYPSRWRYDILKALDYFQFSKHAFDERMTPAIEVLMKKRRKDNRWNVQAKHPGKQHFEMEKAGQPSRWNTLRALRVLKHFSIGAEI